MERPVGSASFATLFFWGDVNCDGPKSRLDESDNCGVEGYCIDTLMDWTKKGFKISLETQETMG